MLLFKLDLGPCLDLRYFFFKFNFGELSVVGLRHFFVPMEL